MDTVYDQWKDPETDETVSSFAIITTRANGLLQSLGVKRMPVIISQLDELKWIKSSRHLCELLKYLAPYPEQKMNAYPVSERINEQGVNEASMLNPIGEKLLVEYPPVKLNFWHWHRKEKHSDNDWSKRKMD
jgi:putative SOS response-associated peptidase YedK